MIFKGQVSRFQSLDFSMVTDRQVSKFRSYTVSMSPEALAGVRQPPAKKKSPAKAGDHEP
jgi:hypothetical protein